MRPTDTSELWVHDRPLLSRRGFRGLSTDIDAPSSPLHPTFDFVDIYAYPGWEPDSVIQTAADLLWDRPGRLGGYRGNVAIVGCLRQYQISELYNPRGRPSDRLSDHLHDTSSSSGSRNDSSFSPAFAPTNFMFTRGGTAKSTSRYAVPSRIVLWMRFAVAALVMSAETKTPPLVALLRSRLASEDRCYPLTSDVAEPLAEVPKSP